MKKTKQKNKKYKTKQLKKRNKTPVKKSNHKYLCCTNLLLIISMFFSYTKLKQEGLNPQINSNISWQRHL